MIGVTRHPAALDQKLYQEYKLLEACVRSVVYHLKNDLEKLYAETKSSHVWYETAGFYNWKLTGKVTMAENNLWYSVIRMKWLQGDGVKMSWIKVKEGEDPCPDYRWIRCGSSEEFWRKSVRGKT